jgi:uncharacterized protein (TIGR00369 family)
MREIDIIELPKPVGYYCFGCGTANDRGLKMTFYARGNTVCSDVVLDEHCVGWENIAHGGIISTLLDETMSWAVVAFKRVFFVTSSLEVRYLRPVMVNIPLTVVGEIDAASRRGCFVKGSLFDEQGAKLATSRGEVAFLAPKRLPMIPEKYRRDMEEIFEKMRELLG